MCCDLCDLYLNCEEVDGKTAACCHKCVEYSECLGGKSNDEGDDLPDDDDLGDLDDDDLDDELDDEDDEFGEDEDDELDEDEDEEFDEEDLKAV